MDLVGKADACVRARQAAVRVRQGTVRFYKGYPLKNQAKRKV